MAFSPNVNEAIKINGKAFQFTEHPSAKGIPYGQTGRRATVYQIKGPDGALHALKVFTQAFRSVRHSENANRLLPFADLPGMQTCRRFAITPRNEKNLLAQYTDLTYAVVMPWVPGDTWQELILSEAILTRQQSFELARAFIRILINLEKSCIAHCDLSGPNIMVSTRALSEGNPAEAIALVDVDDLYAPGLPRPEKLPGGSPGYAHKTAPQGLWSAEADRFAAAVLIAEMLSWYDPEIRKRAYGEQFFNPADVQKDCASFQLMHKTLRDNFDGRIAQAFRQAWQSETLEACPRLEQWAEVLEPVKVQPALEVVIPAEGFVLPTFKPEFRPIDEVEPVLFANPLPVYASPSAVPFPDPAPFNTSFSTSSARPARKFPLAKVLIAVLVILLLIGVILVVLSLSATYRAAPLVSQALNGWAGSFPVPLQQISSIHFTALQEIPHAL